jgi:hypothetical protein
LALLDKEKGAFLIREKNITNRYDKLLWKDKKLSIVSSAFTHCNPEFIAERYNCMISLPDGRWMILSREDNHIGNNYKGWSIDRLDPNAFEISRKLNVHRDEYAYVNRLILLPDGETVLAWDANSPVDTVSDYSSNSYRIRYSEVIGHHSIPLTGLNRLQPLDLQPVVSPAYA